jgi:hypothetical protein
VRFGFFSIMVCGVSWHTHEIGSKMIAIGAQPGDVLGSMLRQEKILTEMPLVAGMLVNVSAMDPG